MTSANFAYSYIKNAVMLFKFVKEAQWSYLVVHVIVLDWIASVCYQQQRIKRSSDDVTCLHNISWLVSWLIFVCLSSNVSVFISKYINDQANIKVS